MSENAFFREWMEAWNSNDTEALLVFYHDDVFYRAPIISHGVRGKEEFRSYLNIFFAEAPGWHWEFVQYFKTKDDRYFVKWKAKIPLDDRIVIEEGLDILEFVDQRISVHEAYFDKSKIRRHEIDL